MPICPFSPPSWRTRFAVRSLLFCPCAGMEGTPRCSAMHRLFLGANQSRHPVAPRTAPWGLHPRCHRLKKCPLAAHKSPSMRKGRQGQCKPGTRREVKSPRGKGQGLLSNATHPLGTMQGVNTGSPGVTLHRGCPLPEPMGTPRCGRHPWLSAGQGLGPAAAGAGAPPGPLLPIPVQLPCRIFSLRRVLSP